jgi:hypothetical protein
MALENDDRATSEGGFDRWQGPDEAFIFARIAEKSWLPFAYSSWRTTSRPFFLARIDGALGCGLGSAAVRLRL